MNGQIVSQATYPDLFSIVGHQPSFIWTFSKPTTGSTNAIQHVAFGNSKYVAVGSGGYISTSTDLITWTSQTSGVATALNAVVWDSSNSLFITSGASNVILTSPDGVTWTSRTSGVTSTIANLVTVSGRTGAVGSAGWVTYSTNGTSWTASQPNSGPSLGWLVNAHSVWFSAPTGAISNGIVYSTDGSTWNYTAKPTTNNAQFSGFDGTYFYLIDVVTNESWRSTNGASWASIGVTVGMTPFIAATSPAIFASGIVSVHGQVGTGYTDDGFVTIKRLRVAPRTPLFPSFIFINPLGSSSQHFAFATTASFALTSMVSVDGKTWTFDGPNNFLPSGQNLPSRNYFINSKYFVLIAASNAIASAPEPYDPTTNFQIPTQTDATGTGLYIKGL